MSSHRDTAVTIALAFSLGTFLCSTALAASSDRNARRESERQYQKGLDDYAQGRRAPALAAFREALRLDPQNPSARTAVQRLMLEASRSDASLPAPAAAKNPAVATRAEAMDDRLLRLVPRYFRFERTVGDALTAQGTLEAMNGRVAQLLSERRFSLLHRRGFGKEREMRALIRRLPSVIT